MKINSYLVSILCLYLGAVSATSVVKCIFVMDCRLSINRTVLQIVSALPCLPINFVFHFNETHYALLGMKHICKVNVYSSAIPFFSYWKYFAILSETEANEECGNPDGIGFVTH
jgi:hypothetical protein